MLSFLLHSHPKIIGNKKICNFIKAGFKEVGTRVKGCTKIYTRLKFPAFNAEKYGDPKRNKQLAV